MNNKRKNNKPIQWHPAFFAGIQIEFGKEADKLIFESEHNLSTKPMQIDILIIKKRTDDVIHKNIGRIFRRYNIVEYKSPTDYISIDDFYKVYGYACFYKSSSRRVDSIQVDDITITFVCKNYPRKFVKHLKKVRGLTIEKKDKGIYYINKDIIPMQLLVTSKLSKEANLWLRSMTNDLNDLDIIDRVSNEYLENEHDELYKSVMNVIIRSNKEKFSEVKGMCEAIRELFEDEFKEAKQQWEREKATEKAAEKKLVVTKMIKKGMNILDICDIAECSEEYVAVIRKSLQ